MEGSYLKFSYVVGLGYKRFLLLKKFFGSEENVWKANPYEWQKVGVNKNIVKNFEALKKRIEDGIDLERELESKRIKYISYKDKDYPRKLKNIESPPLGLFYRGDISLLKKNKIIAVVGTRRVSDYGARMTRRFVRGLVEQENVIVSGMASGVDTIAHQTAINQGGETIGVVAHGIDQTYPSSNKKLKDEIIKKGLIISEYPLGLLPKREFFPARNRIVVGISDKVLVCEAPVKSGTKITVGFAGEQGKDVYVIPGPIDLPGYKGSVEIIRDGGVPVSDVEDVN